MILFSPHTYSLIIRSRRMGSLLLLSVVSLFFLTSCMNRELRFGKWSFNNWGSVKGSGVEKKDTRSVEKFTGVNVKGYFTVEIDGTNDSEVRIIADDNIVGLVETTVKNGILYISLDKNADCVTDLKVILGNKALNFIETSGATNIIVNNLSVESLEVQTSGASELHLDNVRIANTLTLESSGASEVHAQGAAREISVDVSGASDINMERMPAERARIRLSGAGDIRIKATDELDARVSGAGTVTYFGKPRNIRQKVSGAGDISQGTEDSIPAEEKKQE